MTAVWVVIGLVLVFVILPRVFRSLGRKGSSKSWQQIIAAPETDAMMRDLLGCENFTYVAAKVLSPLGIDYMRFVSNSIYLAHGGDLTTARMIPGSSDAVKMFHYQTPSIRTLARITDRPQLPLWMLAAVPDVIDWMNEGPMDGQRIEQLYEGVTETEHEAADADGPDSRKKIDIYRRVIDNYLREVAPRLETQS